MATDADEMEDGAEAPAKGGKTGAFDWVRAVSQERASGVPRAPVEIRLEDQPVLTG